MIGTSWPARLIRLGLAAAAGRESAKTATQTTRTARTAAAASPSRISRAGQLVPVMVSPPRNRRRPRLTPGVMPRSSRRQAVTFGDRGMAGLP